MPEIFIHPDEQSVRFEGEANVLETLVAAGVPITHLCGGKARCSTCRVKVDEGLADLPPRNEKEAAMADRLDFPDEVRLACQTTTRAPLVLRRLVLDDDDAELASQIGKHGLRGPIGREVEIAALFADVADYTSMAESLPPYDVVHMLNRFFNGASEAIEANGGHVDNYIGDAVVAFFGLDDQPQPAAAAIGSGLAVLDVADELNRYVERIYGTRFAVRVGVDYGEAVYGLLGAEETARETAIGDVVNVASRLQGANKQVGTRMLVSSSVHDACTAEIEFGRSFELDLRGRVGLVTAHEVVGVKADHG
jgi:class 3 adenylate cyclase